MMTKPTTALIAAIFVAFSANLAAELDWSIEFMEDGSGKLIWQTDPDIAYNLWQSETLSDPFLHVEGFPMDGIGGTMEYLFDPGTKGFFRIDSAPLGFALIPEGQFEMGDSFDEGENKELPVHTVFVSAFYMETTEVTLELWDEVRNWGKENGYDHLPEGDGKEHDHPAYSIDWSDAMKWCNARSEMEGRSPCYFEDDDRTEVYRKGDPPEIENERVDWTANGYRMPTEAEWEKAARGGLSGKRFPRGNTISHLLANYYSDGSDPYDLSPGNGYPPGIDQSETPYTAPVGSYLPNNYGLYDMTGSVWEWCWDGFDDDYYDKSPAIDPRGPDDKNERVIRGGAWVWSAFETRCSFRRRGDHDIGSDGAWDDFEDHGLRVVHSR